MALRQQIDWFVSPSALFHKLVSFEPPAKGEQQGYDEVEGGQSILFLEGWPGPQGSAASSFTVLCRPLRSVRQARRSLRNEVSAVADSDWPTGGTFALSKSILRTSTPLEEEGHDEVEGPPASFLNPPDSRNAHQGRSTATRRWMIKLHRSSESG
mmetsp:Transcript_9591/g.16554  ORF Transcript_9591/g.16554 Transcript_9591/m.16554 type:complete len:155 (-) Transcript_9591:87-551(-)